MSPPRHPRRPPPWIDAMLAPALPRLPGRAPVPRDSAE